LERLVYSLRGNGDWKGPIVILTDQAEEYRKKLQSLQLLDGTSRLFFSTIRNK
jgi:hypothetical protein